MSARDAIRWGAVIGWGLAAFFFFYGWILRVAPGVMVDQLMREFSLGAAIVGNLAAVYLYAYALTQIPVGMALDRWGPRRVLTVAAAIAAAGCIIFATAGGLWSAYLGRLLIGLGAGFAFVGSMTLAAAWFSTRRFALLSGLGMMGGLLGGVGGQGPLAALVDGIGWRDSMLLLGAAGLILSFAILIVVRDRPAEAAKRTRPETLGSVFRALGRVARRRQTWFLSGVAGFSSAPILVFGALWGTPYTEKLYGLSRPEAAFVVSFILFGWAAGAPSWGWISDRIGRRRLPMVLGTTVGGLSCIVMVFVTLPLPLFYAILVVNGFCGSCMAVSYAAAREHNAEGGTGAALGLINMAAVLGGAIFQPVVGLVLDWMWDGAMAGGVRVYSVEQFRYGLIVVPFAYACALACALCTRETHCMPQHGTPDSAAT